MPIYEYQCKQCEAKFEKLVRSMSNDDKPKCPECGSARTSRALSVFAVGAESKLATASPLPCGRCGGAPGSCQMMR